MIGVQDGCIEELLLDDFRIALSIGQILELSEPVDLRSKDPPMSTVLDPKGRTFAAGDFVLGLTAEKIYLGPELYGTLHTRSKYARLGLEMLCSSNYVAPGSGVPVPIPFVLEVRFSKKTVGFAVGETYCFLLVHRVADSGASDLPQDYHQRFPVSREGGRAKPQAAGSNVEMRAD